MNNNRGSLWGKWDFHVHTPYSILNNGYGFDPYSLEDDLEKQFDEYVQKLFLKAIECDISAIGVTDYFLIDGYKRLKEKYLSRPDKMKELFPNEDDRAKIDDIFVFPNIELRIDSFVGEGAKAVNYHVIFSDELSVSEIEQNFLHSLKYKHAGNNYKSLTKENLISLGEEIIRDNHAKGSALRVGLEHVSVSYESIKAVLDDNKSFDGKYIITVPVDEDLSKVSWNGRDYVTRKNIYYQCDALMTSNRKTINWALAKGNEWAQIREFRTIKPSIWGSDAHSYDRMFVSDEDRFCWVKAVPSFEGLKQMIYEPQERVRIQKEKPDYKDPHCIIESVKFEDENFQKEPIIFNESLNCIIGGKSTGKSLLLRNIAASIDEDYVTSQEKTAHIFKSFAVKKPIVKWADGISENRKIVYIPQTFLNRTIDNPSENNSINQIIQDVLIQDESVYQKKMEMEASRKALEKQVDSDISELKDVDEAIAELSEAIKENGSSKSFEETKARMESERNILAVKVNISDEEIELFPVLERKIQNLENLIESIREEICKLAKTTISGVTLIGEQENNVLLDQDFPNCDGQLISLLSDINEMTKVKWETGRKDIILALENRCKELEQKLHSVTNEYNPLKIRIDENEQLLNLTEQIKNEGKRQEEAERRESKLEKLYEKRNSLLVDIKESRKKYCDMHENFCSYINGLGNFSDTELIFGAETIWKKQAFTNCLSGLFNNKNYSSFRTVHGYDLAEIDESNYSDDLMNKIIDAMTSNNLYGSLSIKTGNDVYTSLKQIFKNWYHIHYTVKCQNDTIEEMSPGKKAAVLLEMIISLEDSKCPILIDQPEDDLDNRFIFNDLVSFIKAKKKERQIIVVTHNANIVLGSDAEEVIIANQDGTNSENEKYRFEYRTGAIENNESSDNTEVRGILNKKGIQTQICEILEGGEIAFRQRQNKYTSLT